VRRNSQGKKLERRMQEVERFLDDLPKAMSEQFINNTPIDTGNARNSTSLRGKSITADYPYAGPLHKGSSRQAPEGMTTPTIEWVRQELRKL